jgi:hypothetical protein
MATADTISKIFMAARKEPKITVIKDGINHTKSP